MKEKRKMYRKDKDFMKNSGCEDREERESQRKKNKMQEEYKNNKKNKEKKKDKKIAYRRGLYEE